jgi:hypothetical protein
VGKLGMLESLRLSVFARMNLSCESVATLCETLCFSARPAFMPFGRRLSRNEEEALLPDSKIWCLSSWGEKREWVN